MCQLWEGRNFGERQARTSLHRLLPERALSPCTLSRVGEPQHSSCLHIRHPKVAPSAAVPSSLSFFCSIPSTAKSSFAVCTHHHTVFCSEGQTLGSCERVSSVCSCGTAARAGVRQQCHLRQWPRDLYPLSKSRESNCSCHKLVDLMKKMCTGVSQTQINRKGISNRL